MVEIVFLFVVVLVVVFVVVEIAVEIVVEAKVNISIVLSKVSTSREVTRVVHLMAVTTQIDIKIYHSMVTRSIKAMHPWSLIV